MRNPNLSTPPFENPLFPEAPFTLESGCFGRYPVLPILKGNAIRMATVRRPDRFEPG